MKGDSQVNNEYSTVDLHDREQISQAPIPDLWRNSYEGHPKKAFDLFWMAKAVGKVAGLAMFLAVSSVTAMPDPWLIERRRRDAVVTVSVYQEVLGRFISRAEALRIARQILEQAEQERLSIAEWEAARGIQWGDQP